MKFKDWVAIMNGVDEFDIFGISPNYYIEEKPQMLMLYGEAEIDEVFIETLEEGDWVRAKVFLK